MLGAAQQLQELNGLAAVLRLKLGLGEVGLGAGWRVEISEIFVFIVQLVFLPDFEGERGSLVVVVVPLYIVDHSGEQVGAVTAGAGRGEAHAGDVDVEMVIAGLVVEIAPDLTGLQPVLAADGPHRLLPDVPQEREVGGPQVSQ